MSFVFLLAASVFLVVTARAQTVSQTPSTGFTSGVACSPNGALTYNGNSFVSCVSGAWAVQPVTIGTQTASCSSTYAGQVQWDSAALDLCNSSIWLTIATTATAPNAFSFTNQTGVNTSTTISSNTVTLTGGFTGPATATCSGCTAIARNGVWGGTTLNGFQSGDTIAIQLTSSGSANTAVTATATVGSTTSGTWSVTTNSTTPSAFSFTNVTGATTGKTYCSNAVTLSGFSGTLSGTCNSGCIAIIRNGGANGGSTLTGFASGDTISICLVASTIVSTAATATVTVGGTTSSTWSVTTQADACAGSDTTVGTTCPDGTVYASTTPDGNVKAYVTPCDAGQSLVSGSCTGTRIAETWNNGNTSYSTTGLTSNNTGLANPTALNTIGATTDSPYNAAAYCATLSAFGYADWYLPATTEAVNTYWNSPNGTAIGGFTTSNGYWVSTEASLSGVPYLHGSYLQNQETKNRAYYIRCMRHN